MATVKDIPQDVLGYIFEYVDDENKDFVYGHPRTYDLRLPDLFPCSVANVCKIWRETASVYSRFWTQFSFDLAAPHMFPLDAVMWSRGLPFRTAIFDSRLGDDESDVSPENKERKVRRIMDILRPHLHRCTALSFNVFYSSSIPSFLFLLVDISSDITRLNLEGRHPYMSPVKTSLTQAREKFGAFEMPILGLLQALSLDVPTFMEMCKLDARWLADVFPNHNKNRTELTIGSYEFPYDPHFTVRYTTSDFFKNLDSAIRFWGQRPFRLTLRHLTVESEGLYSALPTIIKKIFLTVKTFVLENLSLSFMFAFCSSVSLVATDEGTIDNCGIPDNITSGVCANSLCVQNLSAGENRLKSLIPDSIWARFYASNCSDLTDDAIMALSKYVRMGRPNISSIRFDNCNSFSIDALKLLVKTRNSNVYFGRDRNIIQLEMHGRKPHITSEDIRFFRENVYRFSCYSEDEMSVSDSVL